MENDERMFLPKSNNLPYLPVEDDIVEDLNSIFSTLNAGLTLLYCTANTANIPSSANGLCIHMQRKNGSEVATTQLIAQYMMCDNIIFFRTGRGNGTDINWRDWREV